MRNIVSDISNEYSCILAPRVELCLLQWVVRHYEKLLDFWQVLLESPFGNDTKEKYEIAQAIELLNSNQGSYLDTFYYIPSNERHQARSPR